MKKYDLYLFDWDETLVSSLNSLLRLYKNAFGKFGIKVTDEDCRYFITLSLNLAMESKGIVKEEDKLKFYDICFEEIEKPEVIKETILFDDTRKIFDELDKRNIKYGIVTGNYTKHLKSLFDFFDLNFDRLAVVIGIEEGKRGKPFSDPIDVALEKINYTGNRKNVIFIGDALQDENCAKNAGVDYIYIDRKEPVSTKEKINNLLDLLN